MLEMHIEPHMASGGRRCGRLCLLTKCAVFWNLHRRAPWGMPRGNGLIDGVGCAR